MKALILALLALLTASPAHASCDEAKSVLREGDLIFIGIDRLPFKQVAETTMSWTSHVGLALQENGQWVVYESALPTSKVGDLCAFLKRGKDGRFAITRYRQGLSTTQVEAMRAKAKSMLGILYHTGFDLDNWKQFCSKYTHLAYEAAGLRAGKIITFQDLFDALSPGAEKDALVVFWKRWFAAALRFEIPWARRTITPASQLNDENFIVVMGRREI